MMGENKDLNIIFIVSDALRARDLSCYGYSKTTSPNIDKLAKEGIMFEDAYCCVDQTDPSFTTIFSGRYPITHGVLNVGEKFWRENARKINENKVVMLPEILKRENYTTIAVDWIGRWHKKGYDYYSDRPMESQVHKSVKGRLSKFPTIYKFVHKWYKRFNKQLETVNNAKVLTDTAISQIKENYNNKFLLSIHYWDTHVPFYSPKEYSRMFYDGDGSIKIEEIIKQIDEPNYRDFVRQWLKNRGIKTFGEVIADYEGSIAFVDHEIGRIIDTLKNLEILDNTLIIVTADHGQSFTEHRILDHSGLYDEMIHVPLILWYPGAPKNKKVRGFVQHVDLVPTVLDVLGIKTREIFDGSSIVPMIKDEQKQIRSAIYVYASKSFVPTVEEKGIRTRDHKYIHKDGEELYNLSEDPEERNNIISSNPDLANELRDRLLEWEGSIKDKHEKAKIKSKIGKISEKKKL